MIHTQKNAQRQPKKRNRGEYINESRSIAVGYTKLENVDPELNSKRVKFDLFIQKASAGDFDEQGGTKSTELSISLISFLSFCIL